MPHRDRRGRAWVPDVGGERRATCPKRRRTGRGARSMSHPGSSFASARERESEKETEREERWERVRLRKMVKSKR